MANQTIVEKLTAAGWTDTTSRAVGLAQRVRGEDILPPRVNSIGAPVKVRALLPPGAIVTVGAESGVVEYNDVGYVRLNASQYFENATIVIRDLIDAGAVVNNTIVERATSKGLLTVTLDGPVVVVRLAGQEIGRTLDALRAPVETPFGLVTHTVGAGAMRCGLLGSEMAAIEAARAAWAASLEGQRYALALRVASTETDAHPGSKAARAYGVALAALDAFDAAHPEVLAAARAAHHERVLGGKDLLGL